MAYQWITHRREFVPAEAHTLAGQLRAQSALARELATHLHATLTTLDLNWEGAARQRLLPSLQAEPASLDSYASRLEALAARGEALTVTETWSTWEWVPDRA